MQVSVCGVSELFLFHCLCAGYWQSLMVVLSMVVFRVTQGAFVPKAFTSPCPGFQPWENRAWWWSRFKEPPAGPYH